MVQRVARWETFPTGEPRRSANTQECLGHRAAANGDGVKQIGAAGSCGFEKWLPRKGRPTTFRPREGCATRLLP